MEEKRKTSAGVMLCHEVDYEIIGEGLFLTTLSGTGTVLLQSLPFSRMADRILQHAPAAGGTRKGEGSLLGGLGSLIGGDNT